MNIFLREKKVVIHYDDGAHGTHVAGIAAGWQINNQPGFNGVAPGAKVISLKIGQNAIGGISVTGSMQKAFEYAAKYSREHARCGTAFLLTLALLSILVFTLLGPLPMLWRLASRILLIPVLAGMAVEYIRWTANHLDSPIVRWLVKPNLALQSLTTREPDMQMLEVAIQSFQSMRTAEQNTATD